MPNIFDPIDGCQWLVERSAAAFYNQAPAPEDDPEGLWEPSWYPDSPSDEIIVMPCGGDIEPGEERELCKDHAAAMDMPLDEFEYLSEQHDGHAFS